MNDFKYNRHEMAATRKEREDRAVNIMEWAIMLLKAGFIAQLAGLVLILAHHFAYGFLLWGFNLLLAIIAAVLKEWSLRIYPEGRSHV